MRRGSAWRALITGLIALSATAAAARCNPEVAPPALRGDEMICLSFARIWRGSLEDIRNIETTQVPASFRDDYEPDGTCKNT
ncbi:MAG: hypothetical protein ACXWUX_13865, partial [Allosphingosinicella sp.]